MNPPSNANWYNIALSLRYAVSRRGQPQITGTGESVNLSRSGLVFQSDTKLFPGDSIIVALDWPVRAPEGEALYLVLAGSVVGINGQFTAICVFRNELIRARELEKRFEGSDSEGFSSPIRQQPQTKRPIVVLVDEDDQASAVISAIIIADGGIIKRVQPNAVKRILKTGFPPVTLLVTRTASLLDWLPPDIPVILTIGEGAPWNDLEARAAHLPHLAILRKPLIYGVLRNTVHRLYENRQPLERGTSA